MAAYDKPRKDRARADARAERERELAEGRAAWEAEVQERHDQFRRHLAAVNFLMKDIGWTRRDIADLVRAADAQAFVAARGDVWEDVSEAVELVLQEYRNDGF